ncbi:MAG: glycoside hydrolase family 6 protein [Jatrophihabitans sp.]|uniref:glycoside hydrolase family 6 protein n=1 Tax=Jatrophihabitans sp. TaxID=1932789 RepID=UPI003F7F1F05
MPHRRRPARRLLAAVVAAAAALSVAASATAPAGATTTGNPLAGGRWGVFTGTADNIWPAYQAATGTQQALLAKIALRPRVRWFGSWTQVSSVASALRSYIANEQQGDPSVLVQLALFNLWPYGEGALSKPLSAADQTHYKQWVDAAVQGIGSSRVAVVLEPDEAIAYKAPGSAIRFALARYAARALGALPHTSVYLDAAASDWLTPAQAATMLKAAGVQYIRGFALSATHYTATADNDVHGGQVVAALAKLGIPGKHFVVNTADTGRPFTWLQYWAAHPHGDFDNAETCQTRSQVRCVTLGIPPTTDVAKPAWHLSAAAVTAARAWCDGYLWFGRPWLYRQAAPWLQQRALDVARTSPY